MKRKSEFMKKGMSAFLAAVTVITSMGLGNVEVNASTTESSSLQESFGLKKNVQDGVILHAWDWSFNNIKDHMSEIASAGYTTIQTSPIQPYKEASQPGNKTNSSWWLFYQPTDFTVSKSKNDNLLGTEAEFKEMCKEADKYGIKIIVDVVANHVANRSDGVNSYYQGISNNLKRNDFFHDLGFPGIDYRNRYTIINHSMGDGEVKLSDLNTENADLQNYIEQFLEECIDDGADGFRFDAAKHIGVPKDGAQYTFFPNVVGRAKAYYKTKTERTADELYCYGEILDEPGGNTKSADYVPYVNVTDNRTSAIIRNGVSGNPSAAATSYYQNQVSPSNNVLWAESHDEYQNEGGATRYTDISQIKKAWAMVGSRAKATSLFYARTNGYRSGNIGDITTNDWKSKEVVEINKFHNEFTSETEYLSSEDGIAYNERGTSGVVLVNCYGGSKYANVKANKMKNGTYYDAITGNEFKVENGKISGQIGGSGIAVVYNKGEIVIPPVQSSHRVYFKAPSNWNGNVSCYAYGDKVSNANWPGEKMQYDSAKKLYYYDVDGKYDHVMFTDGVNQYPGARQEGLKFTTDAKEWIYENDSWKEYKEDHNVGSEYIIYFKNSYNWGTPYAYMWNDTKNGLITNSANWPGEKMFVKDASKGIYGIKVDASKGFNHIIFSDCGRNQTVDLDISSSNKIYDIQTRTWSDYK